MATTRPLSIAASAICWMRWRWLAKLAVMIRRPLHSAKSERSTEPTLVSLGAWPADSALVESHSSTRTPSRLAISPMRARSVRRPSTGVRSSLKSPVWRMTPWPVCTATAWAWGTLWVTGMNSMSNGPMVTRSPSSTGAQLGAPEQAGLLDAVAGEPERQRRAVDRHGDLAQQVLQRPDVVLVAVRGDDGDDPRSVLAQVREVGQHEVDAVHVRVGEHQPAVDEQDAAVGAVAGRPSAELDRHAVAPDLAEAAEEHHPHGVEGIGGRRGSRLGRA